MSWIFWTRCQWLAWDLHHPWTFVVPPAVLLTLWALSKIKER